MQNGIKSYIAYNYVYMLNSLSEYYRFSFINIFSYKQSTIIKTVINIKYPLLRFCEIKFLTHKLYFVTVMKLDLLADNMNICFLQWNIANGVKF